MGLGRCDPMCLEGYEMYLLLVDDVISVSRLISLLLDGMRELIYLYM